MKNKILIVLFLMLSTFWVQAQRQSAISIGYYAGQSPAKLNIKDSINTSFVGNGIVASKNTQVGEASVTLGMPHDVSYFPTVFPFDVFASKGYFAEYVQLRWNILAMDDVITKVQIYRKPLGEPGDSILIANVATDDFSYRDEFADKGRLYKYTLFAKGIADDLRMPYINYVEVVGFAFPFGTVSGKITYEGGTAVPGVQVLAETKGNLKGKALLLDASQREHVLLRTTADDEEIDLSNGFTLQMWTHFTGDSRGVLFSRNDIELAYEPGQLSFTVQDVTLDMPYNHPVDTFFHVSAVYNPADGLHLYAHVNDKRLDSAMVAGGASPNAGPAQMYLGRDFSGNTFYNGWIDETRLWTYPMSYDEAFNTYSRYIGGTENGLVGFWSMNEGAGDYIYDVSREGFNFNENHGRIFGGEWGEEIPFASQLSYRGVTDENGDYFITGFPYETQGSQYKIIPTFGVHEFDPAQRLLFFGDGANIHNSIDFKDISSFPVSGTIRYRHSNFPVEGAMISVSGQTAIDSDGNLITTDNLGRFTIEVPIGFQSIKISKQGHVFEGAGRFPPVVEGEELEFYDFQEPLAGLEFIDNTVVKFAGKVVGGPVEAEKQLGFGLSKNNLGQAQIQLTTEKGFDVTESDSTHVLESEKHINSSTDFTTKFTTINPDPSTGEFVTYLLPEKYVVTGVTAGSYVFGDQYNVTVNLENWVEQSDSYIKPINIEIDGETIEGFDPEDPALFDESYSEEQGDSLITYGVDYFTWDINNDFILRETPSIDVVNDNGAAIFGESVYDYKDEIREEEVPLLDESGNYLYGYPVFNQRSPYKFNISVFENYTNADTGEEDRVPVKDGKVEIVNDFAMDRNLQILELNEKGKATYQFLAGFPSLTIDPNNEDQSYTKPFSLTAVTGEAANIRTTWRESDPMRAIVFGGVPQGNNFVTNGPNQIITILRDPPGSNSVAYLEKGTTIEQTMGFSVGAGVTNSVTAGLDLGPDVETWVGVGGGTAIEIETTASLEIGLEAEMSFAGGNESTSSFTSTQAWSTSDAPDFVGSPGDVFVGYSTNIVYGAALTLQPVPTGDCTDGNCSGIQNGDYRLGTKKGLRLNPEFATTFIYTQNFIENDLIPNLKEVRNSFLSYSENPDAVSATDEVIYLSLIPPSDERYGTANSDLHAWGDLASTSVGIGPSYRVLIPDGVDSGTVSDTIGYFNMQIASWEFWLAENEKQKLNARLLENISFDGGTSYETSTTIGESETIFMEFGISITASVASEIGAETQGMGAFLNTSVAINANSTISGSQTETTETTYGYALADGETAGGTADYFTIDIKEPSDGFGPVFTTRGGVTSCPYEGEEVTKYYKPGEVLNYATIQVEAPEMSIVNPVVSNVPSNRAAEITLELKNNTQSNDDVYYQLTVNDQTNPNGAILSIDGSTLTGEGRTFLVPAGQVVTKILKVTKGTDDVNDYEDIELSFGSLCDGLSSEQSFSVYFQPGCSDISLKAPADLWVLNTNTTPEGIQNIIFDSYDVQNDQFEYVKFQYKAVSSSQWLTNMLFYNPQNVTEAEYADLDEPKAWLDADGETIYAFEMGDLPDREYDLRVVSVCNLGGSETAETPSDVHTGIKDEQRPVAFGAPLPSAGILAADDEIMVQFNETIEQGLLTPFNISVKGVLNSTEISHNASVNFDGVNDYVKIPVGLDIGGGSWTIEWWMKRQDFASDQVFYSMGVSETDIFEVGVTAGNKLYFRSGEQIQKSVNSLPQDISWNHIAVTYNAEDNEIFAYVNDQYFLERVDLTSEFSGYGEIALGKSLMADAKAFQGNIHELRIWTRYRQLGGVVARMHEILNGNEVSLVGYWPMDEAIGDVAYDKARFRNALVFADWEVSPKGYAYDFDGVSDVIEINTASTVVVTEDMDMTIEFWFNGENTGSPMVMFASGKGDGTDFFNAPENSLSIGFDADGQLYYLHNGTKLEANLDESLLDQNWHHFAISLFRTGNTNMFVDGDLVATTSSDDFGGLSGASMWIGARGYKVGSTTSENDQYFKGGIDEFRIWNTTRRQQQIELNINSRLAGDEIGLMAYYPFEYYETVNGIRIMNSTLEDQIISDLGSGGLAVANGSDGLNQEGPNIKDVRPVTSVDFNWVVNDDKIIITPSETFEPLIEQTILEISIKNVEDLNGNRLASPISWTAFVDRNPVKWAQDQLTIIKEIYEEYTFKVDVVNRGGSEQNFSVDYLPPWLTASPSTGVLDPASTLTVTFTINEGLNTGYYLEDIYLSSDFGFDEKLTIDLSVMSPDPGWEVNASDFQYSMNIVAQLTVSDIISSDVNDQIAVFVDDQIRGVANLQYVSSLDLYEAFLDVYSNVESGEELELRIWDASAGIEYRQATPDYNFSNNALYGTPQSPEMIVAGDISIQTVSIAPGWNWVSFNRDASVLENVNDLLADVESQSGDQIKGAGQNNVAVYTDGIGWLGPLADNGLDIGGMYQMKIVNGGEVSVIGTVADPETQIDLQSGWNYLGYVPRFNMTVNEAFAFFTPTDGDIIKSQFAFAVYQDDLGWIGSLNSLQPGYGYFYKSAQSGTLTYPAASLLSGRVASDLITEWQPFDRHQYPETMTMIAELQGGNDDDLVIVKDAAGNVRGVGERVDGLYYLSIHGTSQSETLTFSVFDPLLELEYAVDQVFQYAALNHKGSVETPYLIAYQPLSAESSLFSFYPNPVGDMINIQLRNGQTLEELRLVDISGKEVAEWKSINISGAYEIKTSELNLTSGVYVLRALIDGNWTSTNLIKE